MTTLVTAIVAAFRALFPVLPAGDPTGYFGAFANSILSSGSNANGSWCKLGEGTMIQVGVNSAELTTDAGASPIYTKTTAFTFPLAFNSITWGGVRLNASRTYQWSWAGSVATLTVNGFTGTLLGDSTVSRGYLSYTAIGKWF